MIEEEHQILQNKLEFNEMLINERNEDILEIHNNVKDIQFIYKELNKMLNDQFEPINNLEEQLDNTLKITTNGLVELQKADEEHKNLLSRKNKLFILTMAGITLGIPFTLCFGVKVGLITGLGTIGATTISSFWNK
jgi:t-SNARE complex subunit (syntaxin)